MRLTLQLKKVVLEAPAHTQDWGYATKIKSQDELSVPSNHSSLGKSPKSPQIKQNTPDQGVPKHAVEAVVKNNPPAQEMQEVHALRTDSTCEPSAKGSIHEHQTVEDRNPNGGVRVKPGDDPGREVAPKHQDTSSEDFAGGVSEGAKKVTLQAEDSPKTSGGNPKIPNLPQGSKTATEKQAFSSLGLPKLGSVERGNTNYFDCSVAIALSTGNKKHTLDFQETDTTPVTLIKFTLRTPSSKSEEDCGKFQDQNLIKGLDTGTPSNVVPHASTDTIKAEEHQRGFTFGFKLTPQQCNEHAES